MTGIRFPSGASKGGFFLRHRVQVTSLGLLNEHPGLFPR